MHRRTVVLAIVLTTGCSNTVGLSTPAGEPQYPTGNGWYCFDALPPTTVPADLVFQGYEYGSLCERTKDACERARRSSATEGLTLPASYAGRDEHPPRHPGDRGDANGGAAGPPGDEAEAEDAADLLELEPSGPLSNLCDLDPESCVSLPPLSRETTPGGFSPCHLRREASCTAYYHEFNFWAEGRPEWHFICMKSLAECRAYSTGLYLHLHFEDCTRR